MSERRAPRLVLEVVYLAALATALGFARLRGYEIAGLMFLGWTLVAVFEWGALRGRAHYGSGLPPEWYVPHVDLPPPRPLEQVAVRYPAELLNDEPTWIASPAMLADWPVADEPVVELRVEEETQVHDVLELELALAVVEAVDEPEPPLPTATPAAPVTTARHRIDPLAEPEQKARRFNRRTKDEAVYAEVPLRPSQRSLPSRSRSED
ncbi:MAG TPA: hypothetical protein VGL76_11265 [Gaiellaceae bacterium]|jgi:hypothetical protein